MTEITEEAPVAAPLTTEQIRERRVQEEEAKLNAIKDGHPAPEHPHMLAITLHQGVYPKITCPGEGFCPLWYGTNDDVPGRCGLQVEFDELGSELLEYMIGPEFTPPTNPFAIDFIWSGGGQDDPPEIEWWPL